jgi:hypothetical protein
MAGRPGGNVRCGSCLLVHRRADHGGDHLPQRLPAPQPERVRLARGLADGGAARGGAS